MRRIGLLLWPAGAALGLLAEGTGFGWRDLQHWVPDLVVGWTFITCGLVATGRRPESFSGALFVATGFTWFIGNFAAVDVGVVAWMAAHALFLHRGPLIHLVLTYPSGRTRSVVTRTAIAAGYVASIVPPLWHNEVATMAVAVLLVVISARDHLHAVGRARRAHVQALQASAALGLVLATEAAIRLALPTGRGNDPLLLAYEAVLVGIAGGLYAGPLSALWERTDVADLVVELGEGRPGAFRGELSRALGDPSLDIGYWLPDAAAFVDAEGRAFSLPDPDAGRAVTMIERDGERIAALVHDPAVLDDPGLVEAVSVAAQLAASNARLQAEVRVQLAELVASRRRILEAADEERRRLARRLHQGAERRLEELEGKLRAAHGSALGDETRERIERAEAQLAQTLEDVRELARGLHPRVLAEVGLAGALAAVVERVPVPVEAAISADGLPPRMEAAVYFVCSEAIANVVKYASASRVRVSVTTDGSRVSVAVEDDGVGGADLTRGSGLRGLADRVEALGGTFRVKSPPRHGTRLAAEIPFAAETVTGSPLQGTESGLG
jgi:signal transduction histidine kinase